MLRIGRKIIPEMFEVNALAASPALSEQEDRTIR
jgi:hypothetical protein